MTQTQAKLAAHPAGPGLCMPAPVVERRCGAHSGGLGVGRDLKTRETGVKQFSAQKKQKEMGFQDSVLYGFYMS